MARVNISIPDPLYERLDRQRDRINASRVCATALEKELDMIEGRTAVPDPDIAQLIQRLQTARERWHQRGREDAKRWAVQVATRQQLYRAKEEFEGEEGAELADYITRRHDRRRQLFGDFDFEAAIDRWVRGDDPGSRFRVERYEADEDRAAEPEEAGFRRVDVAPQTPGQPGQPGGAVEIDLAGYLEGWRDVLVEIWQAVAAALR